MQIKICQIPEIERNGKFVFDVHFTVLLFLEDPSKVIGPTDINHTYSLVHKTFFGLRLLILSLSWYGKKVKVKLGYITVRSKA